MLKPVTPIQLDCNFKSTPASVSLSTPELQLDFIDGKAPIDIITSVASPLTVLSTEVLAINNISVNANIALSGSIITFGTGITGSGEITGSGNIV